MRVLKSKTIALFGAVIIILAACGPTSVAPTSAAPTQTLASDIVSPTTQPATGTATTPEATTSAVPTPGPQAVVQAFYDWYLTDQDYDHLLARPELSPDFVEWLRGFSWAYNPIVCAQDVPDSVQGEPADISGSSATVPTTVSFSGSPGQPGQTVSLTLGRTGWQITAVDCGLEGRIGGLDPNERACPRKSKAARDDAKSAHRGEPYVRVANYG